MLWNQKESGLSVKAWYQEQGLAEHIYYYRLQKHRQAACIALEQAQPLRLTEVPLASKPEESHAKLWLTTKTGTLEIMDADRSVLDQVLQAMLHAEQCHRFRPYLHCLWLHGSSPGYRRTVCGHSPTVGY